MSRKSVHVHYTGNFLFPIFPLFCLCLSDSLSPFVYLVKVSLCISGWLQTHNLPALTFHAL